MSVISPAQIESAAKGNSNDLRTTLQSLVAEITGLRAATGTSLISSNPAAQGSALTPPVAAGLSVTGANGTFVVDITNPAQNTNTPIYHEVSFSTSSSFSGAVTTLPLSTTTHVIYPAPGVVAFWRVRSTFDQKAFGPYVTAGTTGTDAGLQSTAASVDASPLNQSNYATIDSVASGGSANVRIYGPGGVNTMFPSVKGSLETLLPSATVIGVPYSSNPVIAHGDDQYQPLSRLPQAFADSLKPVGTVSVVGIGAVQLPTVSAVYDQHGHVIAYSVDTPGNGLTGPVTLTITDASGTGATFGAQVIHNGKLISVSPGNPGQGYSGHEVIVVTGGTAATGVGGGRSIGGD